ncbi:hypothetical protein TWF788_000243 [Orbilia oligospora]|uniref:Uncharacterized protein n=1 Tax=Orbilia oligospora TaxID=2813651 RepID=A0A7C8Q411_ORBOL|nr:hypothetical protein TWF788_000243 [Orbilia oligospora]
MDSASSQGDSAPSTPAESTGSWWSVKRAPSSRKTGSRKSWIKNTFGLGRGAQTPSENAEMEISAPLQNPPPTKEVSPVALLIPDTPPESKAYDPVCPWDEPAGGRKTSAPAVVQSQARPTAPLAVRSKSEAASSTLKVADVCPWEGDAPLSPPQSSSEAVAPWNSQQPMTVVIPLSPPASRPNSELITAPPNPPPTSSLPSPPPTSALPSPPPTYALPSPPPSAPPSIPLPRPPSPDSVIDDNASDGSHYDDDEVSLKSPSFSPIPTIITPTKALKMTIPFPVKQQSVIVVEEEVVYDEEDRLLIREEDWGEYNEEDSDSDSEPHYTYDEGYQLIDQMYDEDFADDVDEVCGDLEVKNMMTMMDIEAAIKNLFPTDSFMVVPPRLSEVAVPAH